MTILRLQAYSTVAAYAVLSRLDASDLAEAEVVRGAGLHALDLSADWRDMEPHRLISLVAYDGPIPFAVVALYRTGVPGVAGAALLARDHGQYRRALGNLALMARADLPGQAARFGLHRIEVRSWAGHPRAHRLLAAVGFHHEADCAGFGPSGREIFRQFAWVAPSAARNSIPPN